MPDIYDHVDLDGFGDVVDGSDAPSEGGHLKDDDELHNTQDQLAEAKMILEAYAKELKKTRVEMRQMAQRNNDLEQQLKEAKKSYENELSIVRQELQDAKDLASVSASQKFIDAEAFPTTVDALSISQVVEKVNYLNEEIFQAAALLGEEMTHIPHTVSQEEMDSALRIAQGMIGSKIIQILREQSRKEVLEASPLIVQVVLQVFLVTRCSKLVHYGSNYAPYQAYLASRIRGQEDHAVSGRWRALIRDHTRPTLEGWKEDLLLGFNSVLRVALWMIHGVQRDAFQQKLEYIFRAAEDLRIALGEKVTSADLEVFFVDADQAFQPKYMDDAYGYSHPDRKRAPQEVVAGTTSIGLKKLMLKRSAQGEVIYKSVLSPKVALESTLLEALQLPPAGTGASTTPSSSMPAAAGTPRPPVKTDQTSAKPQQQRRTPPELGPQR